MKTFIKFKVDINSTRKILDLIFCIRSISLNYNGGKWNTFPVNPSTENKVAETPLSKVFNLDKLNFNNDPQEEMVSSISYPA
jgi:hypothetical protein